jgi:Uma2 family endonuclease
MTYDRLGTSIATQAKQALTFEQFLEQYPEDGRYELIDGELVRMLATRRHENVAELIQETFKEKVKRLKLNFRISSRIVLATISESGIIQGRHPDVSVVDKTRCGIQILMLIRLYENLFSLRLRLYLQTGKMIMSVR